MNATGKAQLLRKFSDLFDGRLAEEECAPLAGQLATDDEVLALYLEFVALDLLIANQSAAEPQPETEAEASGEVLEAEDTTPVASAATASASPVKSAGYGVALPVPGRWLRSSARNWTLAAFASTLAVAVVFYGSFVAISWNIRDSKMRTTEERAQDRLADRIADRNAEQLADTSGAEVARITGADNAAWRSAHETDPIEPGHNFNLDAGIVSLTLTQGTALEVQGPAVWTIVDDNRVRLQQGKLLATVPHQAIGFTVETPTSEIVDLGTEFSVTVAPTGSTDLHVLTGEVQIQQVEYATADAKRPSPVGTWRRVSAGQSLRSIPASHEFVSIPHDASRIVEPTPEPALPELKQTIPLGNLFDDTRQTPLADALKTDPFGAEATADSLGVERVSYGGDARQEIAPNVWFDFSSMLWNDRRYGTIANDSVTLAPLPEESDQPAPHAISTRGVFSPSAGGKQEDGIGMQANSLLTFDLDELRRAAGLADRQPVLFRCDRAGINDTVLGSRYHAAQMVVIVSGESRVLGAWLNGRFHTVSREDGVWRFANPRAIAPRANGAFVELALPVTSDVRWLTLAVADGGARRAGYSVWSGARIAGVSQADQANPYFDRSRPLAREAKASDFSAAFLVSAPVPGLLAHWEGDDLPGPDGRPSAAATFVADGIHATEIATDAGKPANVDLGPTTGRSISTAIAPYRGFAEKAGALDENRQNFGTRYYTFSVALDAAAARRGTLALSEVSACIAHPVSDRTGQYRFDYSTDGIHFVEGEPGTFEGTGWHECRQALSLSGIQPGAKVQFRLVLSTSVNGGSVRMDDVQLFGKISPPN